MNKTKHILFLLFLMAVLAYPAMSGTQEKAYRIGPNDVLGITIYAGGEQQHASTLTVSAQGTINAPFIGTVKAEGLTPTQLETQITAQGGGNRAPVELVVQRDEYCRELKEIQTEMDRLRRDA